MDSHLASNWHQLLFEHLISGVVIFEVIYDDQEQPIDYRYWEFNPAFEQLTGLRRADVLGRRLLEAFPEAENYWFKIFAQVVLTGQPTHYTNFAREVNRYFETLVFLLQPGYLAVSFTDVTERQRLEEALRLSEYRYRQISELISDFAYSFRLEPDGRFVREWVSGAFETITGMAPADPRIQEGIEPLVHPEDREVYYQRLERLRAGETVTTEFRIITPQGEVRWLQTIGRPTWDATHERVTGYYGATSDITHRKETELALQAAEIKYRDIFENAIDGLFQSTPDGRFLQVNPAMAQIYGYASPADLVREVTDIGQQLYVQPAERNLLSQQLVEQGAVRQLEVQGRKRDGTLIWTSESVRAVYNDRGQILYYEGSIKDISERKATELRLQQQAEQLLALNQMGQTVTASLDLPEVLQRVTAEITRLVQAEGVSVLLLAGTDLVFAAVNGIGADQLIQQRIPASVGIAGQVLITGQSIRFPHPQQSAQIYRAVDQTTGYHTGAVLAVALASQGRRVGVLEAVHSRAEAFASEALGLLESAAQWVSVAITNARLFAETTQTLERERQQLATLRALYDINLDLSAQLDLSSLLQTVVERAAQLFNASVGCLGLLHPQQELEIVAGVNLAPHATLNRFKLGAGLLGQIAQRGHPILVNHYAAWEERLTPSEFTSPVQSAMGVPVQWQQQLLGVMIVGSDHPERFKSADGEALSLLANQAAVALVNARHFEETQHRLRESETLTAISRALSETLDPFLLFNLIVTSTRRLVLAAERAIIHQLDEDSQTLHVVAIDGLAEFGHPDFPLQLGEGLAGLALVEGQLINVADVRQDARYKPSASINNLRSMLVAPIQTQERRLGALTVVSRQVNAFSTDDERLLTVLSLQAALVIQNSALYTAERQQHLVAETLREAGNALSATLDLETILDRLLDQVAQLAPYDLANIMGVREGQAYFLRVRGYENLGPAAAQYVQGVTFDMTQTVNLHQIVQMGQSCIIPDVTLDPTWIATEVSRRTRSWIGVPIIAQGRTLALFALDKFEPNFYRAEHAHRLTALAGQAALALQNADLFRDLEKALQQEKSTRAQLVQSEKLAAMGRLIASVAHELNNPLQAIQNTLYLVKTDPALSEQTQADLQVIADEANRMTDLIQRLRETYRPLNSTEFQLIALNAFVNEVRRLLAAHAHHHHINFELALDPAGPLAFGIRDHLKQVLINLCLNAIEAMPEGGVLTVTTQGEAEGSWIRVTDTGVGIAPADLPNLFEPFYTTKPSGTGLGLPVSYEIIQNHQGRLEIESALGKGSTFKVWLPKGRSDL